jgi:spermidine/putrescine transport system substrate-binding protein
MTFDRRTILKFSVAGLAAPMILKASDALASSGKVKVLAWGDYVQPNIVEAFEAETGISLELTTFGSNDEAESVDMQLLAISPSWPSHAPTPEGATI